MPSYLCVCVCVCPFELQQPKENRGPNLLSAENEDCALNGDPMAHVHKDLMANSLASEAVQCEGADRTTSTGSIILEERLDSYSERRLPKEQEIKENLTSRDILPLVLVSSLII